MPAANVLEKIKTRSNKKDAAYAASEHEKGAARLLLKSYVMLLAFYQKKLVI